MLDLLDVIKIKKKEVFPVQAWVVSEPPLNNDRNGGFKDPIPPKKNGK